MKSPHGRVGSTIVIAGVITLACILFLTVTAAAMQPQEGMDSGLDDSNELGIDPSLAIQMQDTGESSVLNGSIASEAETQWVRSGGSSAPLLYHGWIEWAEDTHVDQVTAFNASWRVPSSPPDSERFETIYLFHGISPDGGDGGIVQAVLEWNRPDTGPYWTGAAWGSNSVHDDIGNRIRVNEGDLLTGSILWNESDEKWYVQLEDQTTGDVSSVWTDAFTSNTDLEVYVSMEGYNFRGNGNLPGDAVFFDLTLANSSDPVRMQFSPRYGKIAERKLSDLHVDIEDDPLQITLHTPN
ncbi:MAG TPA: hypothetical protein VE134_10130 [Methanomicrobiales archaeon]|nr:hypothetical protein [Methanomicrobiales archaeon]